MSGTWSPHRMGAMCLLAIAWNVHPRWRLVLAGNRDEFHARPTAALARWKDRPDVLAGRDLQSGGTWAGIDTQGRIAVVTNVRDPTAPPGPDVRSRGQLTAGFLAGTAAAGGQARIVADRAGDYAPFNLLLADATHCTFVGNHPRIRTHALEPGVHGISNGDLDEPWPKVERLKRAMSAWLDNGDADPSALWQALADETRAADSDLPDTGVGLELERTLSPAFIRGPAYGTRASTLIAIGHDGEGWIGERRFGPDGRFEGETRLDTPPSGMRRT